MRAIKSKSGGLYFLDAPGGTGKTFLILIILAAIRYRKDTALAMASSRIEATLLEGRRTAHSALKLPLNIQFMERPTCNITKKFGNRESSPIMYDHCGGRMYNGAQKIIGST